MTFRKTIVCFSVIFVIFLGLSIFLYVEVSKVKEVSLLYYDPDHNSCNLNSVCEVSVTLPEEMQAPVYLMYYLSKSTPIQPIFTRTRRGTFKARTITSWQVKRDQCRQYHFKLRSALMFPLHLQPGHGQDKELGQLEDPFFYRYCFSLWNHR